MLGHLYYYPLTLKKHIACMLKIDIFTCDSHLWKFRSFHFTNGEIAFVFTTDMQTPSLYKLKII